MITNRTPAPTHRRSTEGLTGYSARALTQVEFGDELAADGQAARIIIKSLGGDGIAAIEYDQVAKALHASGDNVHAIAYYDDAIAIAADPDTRASALRNEAFLRYDIGESGLGHQGMLRAAAAYRRQGVMPDDAYNGIAQSYLQDAQLQIRIMGCQIAQADLTIARN
jgi:hypothetical protein